MAKTYKGSLTLDWYNKQKSILLSESSNTSDIPAPSLNWINKDESLFYEIDQAEGRGIRPYWVNREDIRIKEARPLVIQGTYKGVAIDRPGTIPGTSQTIEIQKSEQDDQTVDNLFVKGDNLLALNAIKKHFDTKPASDKIKCIYIDPPYTTGQAFEHYDDNLEQSEWFTMIRDRTVILHSLLREDGVFFIQLDEKNIFHMRLILDEIFGKQNFVKFFVVKTSDPSGLKTINPAPYDAAEYILMYAKQKTAYTYVTRYVESGYDAGYNKVITNLERPYSEWKIVGLSQFMAEKLGYLTVAEARQALGKLDFQESCAQYAINNAEQVFQATAIANNAGSEIVKIRDQSIEQPDVVIAYEREKDTVYALNGRQIAFFKNKVRQLDGKLTPTLILTNIWNDVPYNGISSEGQVKFKESKKPEKLIKRIYDVANVKPGDYVLDCFAGSGTSLAVAQKMGLKWVGVEVGNHADTHVIKRLTSVLTNQDSSGVTNITNWQGGGGFKYYHLGPSIIAFKENGEADFNWQLGKSFIEESFLLSYDYALVIETDFLGTSLFPDPNTSPKIGVQGIGSKVRVAVVSLNTPGGPQPTISYDELRALYTALKRKFAPQYINIFTNRGIELAYDSKPDDLEVIKIPHAIFAELEK